MHKSPHVPILIGAALIASSLATVAAPIAWQAADDTTAPTAVVTRGAMVEAVNASPTGGVVTVNGVTFSSTDALLPLGAVAIALSTGETLDPGLDELLTTMDYGGGTAISLSVGGGALVPGQSYIIQVFYTDLRSCCSGRVMTFGDGLGGVVGVAASGGGGSFGQNAIGTFVAGGTSQTLSLAANGFGNVHVNAYQIRSAVELPVIEGFSAEPALIAGGETSTLAWQIRNADSAMIDNGVGAIDPPSGSATVSPATTTTYTLTASNAGGSVSAEVTVGVDVAMLEPELSEFLASNDANLADEDGAFSDWIEIHNPNAFAIDLGGYYLTDDATDLAKWPFPAGTMLGGDAYLVVFASAVARGAPELHTNFALSADGEFLALVAPDGSTVIAAFADFPDQRSDISYGVAGGTDGYFSPPTPGAPNGTAFAGFVADTTFDVDRGFFDAPFTVTISAPTPGASIVYTLDGSMPSPANGVTSAPASADSPGLASVLIAGTTVLRAAAFKDGFAPTDVDTQTYLFAADIIDQPAMDPEVTAAPAYSAEMVPALKSIRSLSIVTDPDNLFGSATGILANTGGRGIAWERPVSIEFIDPQVPAASCQTDAGLRMHGNGSRSNAKNSLRLLFRADYGAKKLDYPLFGRDWVAQKFNTVVLRAQNANSWTSSRAEDRAATTFLQDSFAKDTQGAMGHPTAGSTFVHLFLNGVYWGLYNPTERPDGSFGEDHFGGDDSDYDAVNRRFAVEVLSGTKTFWDEMIAHSDTLLDSQQEYAQLAGYIDIDNLIDYMLVHQYMQTRDGPDDFGHNNMRLVRRNHPPGPFRAYAWDMEYSMIDTAGTRDYSYPFPIYSSPRSGSRDITDSIASVYIRLKDNNPEFRLRYADRAYRHLCNGGALTEQIAAARFEARALEIESAIICESARWGDQQRATPYTRDAEWAAERSRLLTEFFPARPAHVISQLRIHGLYPNIDPPTLSQHGGVVPGGFELALAAAAGTIYFTTDGSDPREAWTGSALGDVYVTPVALTRSLTIKARALDDGEWSALAEASFRVGTPADSTNLVVSEIFYQPDGPSEALEFIELANISPGEIDLTGVRFTAGIDFDFAENTRLLPGARLLVVRDPAAFAAEFGVGLPIAGEFQNATGLSDSGERLTLLAADGSTVRDFRYETRLPWPTSVNGFGHSLVLIDPGSNPDHARPSSWRASTAPGGNPNTSDATTFAGTAGTDADDNGIDDLLDYALGPGAASALSASTEGNAITISYTHQLAADDVALAVEWSRDLATWSPPGIAFDLTRLAPLGSGLQRVEFTSIPATFDPAGRIFFRLVAE